MLDWLRRLPPNVQGALWLVSGGFIFTSTSAMIRLLSTQVESVQTAFFRAVISVILLLPMIAAGRVKPWQSKRIVGHFWRTAMGTGSMVLGFYAVTLLPLADATAIAFSQPLFSVVVAALLLGEKVRWRRWSATVIGFAGVLIMVRPGEGSLQLGALVGLANAAAVSLSILLVRRLSMLPVECVVRGYLAGSGWRDYERSGAVSGISLPAGLRESDQLPQPIFTPSTKAAAGHDEAIDFEAAVALVGGRLAIHDAVFGGLRGVLD